MPDARLLAGAAALFGVGAAGLGVPAPIPQRQIPADFARFDPPDPQWPDLLHQWINTAHRGLAPQAITAEFVGTGRIRLGRSPWLPVAYRTSHLLGKEFMADVSATWFGRPVVRGMDAYVEGRGLTRARETVTFGPGLDSGGVSFLWSEAMLVPSTWRLPGVKWTQLDDTSLSLDVSAGELASPVSATVTCDPQTGLPESFQVPWRAKNPEGTVGAAWLVTYEEWRTASGAWAPGLVEVKWLDEDRPWFRLRMEPAALNVDVSQALNVARDVLATREGK